MFKDGKIGGGRAWIALWNPHGPDEEVVGLCLCSNRITGVAPDIVTFNSYFNEISASNAWPDYDLFDQVVKKDEQES